MKNKKVRTAAMFMALLLTCSCFFVGCNRWKEKNTAQNTENAETEESTENIESDQAYDLLLDAYKKTKKANSIQFSLEMTNKYSDDEIFINKASGTYSKDDNGELGGYYDSEQKEPSHQSSRSLLHYGGYDYTLYGDSGDIAISRSHDMTISEACLDPYLINALGITSFLRLAKNLSNSDFTLSQNENSTAITVDGNSSEVLKILFHNNYDVSKFNEKKATHSEGHLEIKVNEKGFLSGVDVLIDYQSKNNSYTFDYTLELTATESQIGYFVPTWAGQIIEENTAINRIDFFEKSPIMEIGDELEITKLLVNHENIPLSAFQFESSNKKIATVDSDGIVYAHLDGRTTITVTVNLNGQSKVLAVQLTVWEKL